MTTARPDPRLMRHFALTGALAIACFSAAMAWWLTVFLETRLVERDAALSHDFVQSIVDTQRVAELIRRGDASDAGVIEFASHVAALPDVLRANLYSTNRKVLWSSRPELIGQVFSANEELDEALAGEVVTHRSSGEGDEPLKAEHLLLPSGPDRFVENYLPIRSGPVLVGVVELYREPVALNDAIFNGRLRVWLGAAAGAVFLFLSLMWFVLRTERALREQQSRLVEAEALAMVGELSAAVAHSIRNPLGVIRSSGELQREMGADAPPQLSDDVIRSADRIEHLVRTLLTYAREPGGRDEQSSLDQLLQEAAARFEPDLLAQGKPFEVQLAPQLGHVAVDPVLMAQVLASVLANAAEATQRGQAVRLHASAEGPWAKVVVADEGCGIPPEQLAEVTRPFMTTKPRGLGLGLALVRRVVERLGGRIELDSPAGGGTRVTLHLPRT